LGGVAIQNSIERAETEACGVRESDLLAFEAQLIGVAVAAGWARGTAAIAAVERTQLAFIVAVGLDGTIQIQCEVVIFSRGKGQAAAGAPVLSFYRRWATAAQRNLGIGKFQVGAITVVETAAQRKAELVFDQRATGIEIDLGTVAVIAVFLRGVFDANRGAPFLTHFARDDVDYAAQCVGTIERGHRAANHF